MIQVLTLIEYARTRGLDPTTLLDEFTTTPDRLPEPHGDRAGQPTYDPDQLDHARGVTTLAGFARLRGWPVEDVRRWDERQPVLWPKPVGKASTGTAGAPAFLYPLDRLEAVAAAEAGRRRGDGVPDDLVTLAEYAEREGLNLRTVRDTWKERYKEVWPGPARGADGRPLKRGRAHLFRVDELERVRGQVPERPEQFG